MKRLLLPLLGIIPLFTMAGGFQVNLQGTKQTGMGHLGAGFYLGASSTYFNPAMMGMDEGKVSIEAGVSFIRANVGYQNTETGAIERTDNPTGTPFYLYGTYKISDKVSAGLAVFTPFGSSVDWGEDFSGRELIQDISLTAINIQPTVSYMINEKLRVGGGLNVVLGSVDLSRDLGGSVGNGNTVNLEGSTTALGYNAGVHFMASEKLSFGLTYKSKVEVELTDGDATFDVNPVVASTGVRDTKFDATLPLPSMTTFGIAYKANEKLLISAEVNYIGWDAYESLDFDFKDNSATLQDSENPRNYENSMIYRIGAQYTCGEVFQFRLGAYYDESPVQDDFFSPETPNSDNIGLTAGLTGQVSERFSFDVSFLYIIGQERTSSYTTADGTTFGGNYSSKTVVPGVGFNYKF